MKIVVDVTTGVDRDAIMALDDITYTSQCVKYNGTISTRPTTTTTPCTGSSTTTTRYTGITTITTTTKYTEPSTTTTIRTTTTTRSVVTCAQYCYNGGTCKPPTTELGKPKCVDANASTRLLESTVPTSFTNPTFDTETTRA
ncbi:unnamed protein product [Rotaria sordida]|uniref:Uncharacterized protein n=1 Tax=Rotaria sordida TaxID=392033 RepID=A0A815UVD6_9BILA|nr:unnamed protein product [Rotaria sordida]CAF1514722.1 unnamed protein product [Rotaria sordida]CAF1522280.1 unnamed protein product [Rotaria sordida]